MQPLNEEKSMGEEPVRETDSEVNFSDEIFSEWLDSAESEQANNEKTGDLPQEPEQTADSTQSQNSSIEPDSNTEELETELENLKTQLAEARDQLLRKAADFENFRKRMNQEKQNAMEFANQSLLLDIIPVIDDFERAVQSAQTSEELAGIPAGKAMLDGIIMIEKRLVNMLDSKWGLKRFNSAGELFDPNIHEAMFMEKSPDVDEPVVQEDLIKGYTLKERVIRAAKVKVLLPEDVK